MGYRGKKRKKNSRKGDGKINDQQMSDNSQGWTSQMKILKENTLELSAIGHRQWKKQGSKPKTGTLHQAMPVINRKEKVFKKYDGDSVLTWQK